MSKDEIRVQYSGFIVFAAQILGVVTGVVFTLLLTRNMTTQEYGIWSNIFDLVGYFTIFSGLFPFWATRFVARGIGGTVRTSLLANMIVALGAMAVYFPAISLITKTFQLSGAYVFVYFVAAIQIINVYLLGSLEGCLRSMKPQAIGYGLLVEEVCKVTLAYVLVAVTHQLFLGAMLGLIIGASVQTVYYLRLVAKNLKEKIQWNYLRQWLKGSTVIFYNAVGNQITALGLILLFVYGGQVARGEYQAATTFANIVGYSSLLTFALYPKLLAKNSLEDVTSTFKTMMMFAIPMAAVVMTLAQSLLTILNVYYGVASLGLILLTLDTLVALVAQFYNSLLLGVERMDQKAEIPLRKLVRSKIFKVFTLPYIQAAIALPAMYYALTQLTTGQPIQALLWVTTINMIVHAATFLGLYAIMRESVSLHVPRKNIAKYLFASAVPAILLYLGPRPTTLFPTFEIAVGGLAVYAMLLLTIDREARTLVGSIWLEIRGILRE